MNLSRRSFLGGLFAAPAIVTASNLMPIKVLPFEPYMIIRGFDILSNEWVERRIYEKGTFDDFVNVDFLNRYEETSRFLRNVETAIALNRESENTLSFVNPVQRSTWCDGGDRHIEHVRELEDANKTRNDPVEIDGKYQDFIDVHHNWEISRGNADTWSLEEYDRLVEFREKNLSKVELPKVRFNVAVKSIGV